MSTTQPTRTAPKKTAPAATKAPVTAKSTAAAGEDEAEESRRRRGLEGVVVSNKMNKTCVVQVIRRFRHPKYKKYVNERQRYKAHDESNAANVGDRVIIVESRPLSKDKRWRLQKVLEKAETV